MADSPKLSLIMPVRNEEKYLARAVESIFEQNYLGELEVILAVAPSVDKTEEIAEQLARKYSSLKVIANPKGLTTCGLNLAIEKATGKVIVRVDAHSELGEGYLTEGVETLRRTGAVLAGGIMNAVGATPLQRAIAFGYRSRIGLGGGQYHLGGKAGEAESAYLGIFDAVALKEVGGYDENIIRGEDWELAQRLKAKGGKVWFNPELSVNYHPRSNLRALAWQFYSTGVWRGELTRRAPGKASMRYFLPPVALLGLIDLSVLFAIGAITVSWLIIPIALYLGLIAIFAALASSLSLADRAATLIAIPVMHFSWAIGFWIGLIFGARKIVDSGARR